MTTLTRYGPIRSLRREFDRLFEDLVPMEENDDGGTTMWAPPVDFSETEDAFLARVDLPGMKEEDIKVELQDNRLTISGERRHEVEEKGENFHRIERTFGSFFRALSLPAGVKEEDITATFTDGVLHLHMPKVEARRPQRIPVGKKS